MVGVDISDATIEVAELERRRGAPVLLAAGRVSLPEGIIQRGVIIKENELLAELRRACQTAVPRPIMGRRIVFGLPETQFYNQIVSLPVAALGERRRAQAAAATAAANLIPLPVEEQVVTHKILSRSETDAQVLLFAVSRATLRAWHQFFRRAGFELTAFEPEPVALSRGILVGPARTPFALLDLGSRLSQLSFFDSRGWLGAHLLSPPEGESGSSNLDHLVGELEKALAYMASNGVCCPDLLMLAGGGSQRSGIVNDLSGRLTLPVRLALLPTIFSSDHNALRRFWLRGEAYYYLEAVGLALGALGFGDPVLDPRVRLAA